MRWLTECWTSIVGTPDPNPDVLAQIAAVLAANERMAIRWRLGKPETYDQWKQRYQA